MKGRRSRRVLEALAVGLAPTAVFLGHGAELWRALRTHYPLRVGLLWGCLALTLMLTAVLFAFARGTLERRSWPPAMLLLVGYGLYLLSAPVFFHTSDPSAARSLVDALYLIFLLVGLSRLPFRVVVVVAAAVSWTLMLFFVVRTTLWSVGEGELQVVRPPPQRARATGPNLYHLVLDGFAVEGLRWLAEEDPEVAALLRDFTVFPNFVANYAYTRDAFASLRTGEVNLSQTESERQRWRQRAAGRGLWRQLKDAGYRLQLYTTFSADCPYFADDCLAAQRLVVQEQPLGWSRSFVDALFLRTQPLAVQQILGAYPNRALPFGPATGRERTFSVLTATGLAFVRDEPDVDVIKPTAVHHLRLAIAEEALRPATGHYVFLHTLITHRPYELDRECRYVGRRRQAPADNFLDEARCALRIVQEFVGALKASGRWEDALVILQSDHGHFRFEGDEPGKLRAYRSTPVPELDVPGFGPHVVDATAAFAIVRFPRGELAGVNRGLAHHPDIAATLAAAAKLDFEAPDGLDLHHLDEEQKRRLDVLYWDREHRFVHVQRTRDGWEEPLNEADARPASSTP